MRTEHQCDKQGAQINLARTYLLKDQQEGIPLGAGKHSWKRYFQMTNRYLSSEGVTMRINNGH